VTVSFSRRTLLSEVGRSVGRLVGQFTVTQQTELVEQCLAVS